MVLSIVKIGPHTRIEHHQLLSPPVFLRSTAHEHRYPSRVKSYEAIEWLTSEKSGVGAKWKQARTVYGKSHTQTIEVVEWREPTSFALTATEAGATYLTRYSLRGLDVFRGPAQQPVQ